MATEIEISPGVTATLRSKEETLDAIRHDFILPVACFGCCQDLFCIADAQYVICPTCRVVSPLLQQQQQQQAHDGPPAKGGLGLGVSFESLFEIQSEIVASMAAQRNQQQQQQQQQHQQQQHPGLIA